MKLICLNQKYGSEMYNMEAYGEYRVGHNNTGRKHWIECRGEIIARVRSPESMMPDESIVWHFKFDDEVFIESEIPTWDFRGTYPSIGHALVAVAKSHRRFMAPNSFLHLWREMSLWPLWGKLAAAGGVLCVLGALAEILSFVLPLLPEEEQLLNVPKLEQLDSSANTDSRDP